MPQQCMHRVLIHGTQIQRNGFEAAEGAALHYWINVFAGIAAIKNGGSAQLMSLHFSF
jgi:hypothetical protein